MKKIIAILSALALMFSLASCGSSDATSRISGQLDSISEKLDDVVMAIENSGSGSESGDVSDDTAGDEAVDDEESVEDVVEEVTDASGEAVTDASGEKVTKKTASTTKKSGSNSNDPSSWSKEQITDFYKKAAKNTSKDVKVMRYKTLDKLNGGEGGLGSLLSKLEGAAKSALEKNSGEDKGVRGFVDLIVPSDFSSVSAKKNGNFVELNLKVKDYTATAQGRENEGSVGHVIGVLDSIDAAINEISGVSAEDTSNVKLVYTNASVVAKIDTTKNVLVSATWVYKVDVVIKSAKIKAFGIPVSLTNADVVVGYKAVL